VPRFYRQIGDGAFTTRDTYLDQKPYLYCEHDPVNAVDPSGHDIISDLLGLGAGSALVGAGETVVWAPWIGVPLMIWGTIKIPFEIHEIYIKEKERRLNRPIDPDPRQEVERNRDLYPGLKVPNPRR